MTLSPLGYYLLYSVFFVLAVLFSTMINGLFLKFSRTLGIRQAENQNLVRWASTAKPSVGGFSFYILFLISVSVYAIFRFSGQDEFNLPLVGLILACSLGFLLGLADDAYNTVPSLKFAGQLLCGVVLIASGIVIEATDSFALNALFTMGWVVGIMNSINMLDNMDGIAATVSAMIMLGCLAVLEVDRYFFSVQTFMMIGVVGAITGFMIYNFNPAKLYMGDTGSQFLGVLLAGLSIMLLWNHRDPSVGGIQFKQFLVPSLAFVMPVMDTLTVFIHRLRRGQSPFVGGKDHTTHHLVYLGLTDRQVWYAIGGLSALCNALAVLVYYNFDRIGSLVTFVVLMGLVVFFLLIQFVYLQGKPTATAPQKKTPAKV
jgi:UDP-GlcNAc:undecaprenyl-phosphate/decaprenyl-phosphate GlcNAc-1-phosphate transferase